MVRRRRMEFAAPLVMTVVMGGCDKPQETFVLREGTACFRVTAAGKTLGGVACPARVDIEAPPQLRLETGEGTYIEHPSVSMRRTTPAVTTIGSREAVEPWCDDYIDFDCAPGTFCNPPETRMGREPCPPELLGRLRPGLAPTERTHDGCGWNGVPVVCP